MATSNSDVTFYCFLFILCFISSILVRSFLNNRWSDRTAGAVQVQHPPSPPALPIIGHLHLLRSSLPKSFQTLARRYGPLMQLRMGASTFIVVSNATVAREIMKTHDIDFASRGEFGSSEYNIYKGSDFFTAPYGTYWRFIKKVCVNEIFTSSQLNRLAHIREEEIRRLLESLVKTCGEGEMCNLSVALMSMTNNVITRMAMSTRCSENANKAKEIEGIVKDLLEVLEKLSVGEVLGPLAKFDIFGYGKKFRSVLQRFDRLVEGIMKDREEKEMNQGCERVAGRDLMDIMLDIQRDKNAEVKLTRNDVKAFFRDMFIAGTETSSLSIQWAMAELINHPRKFKKLREEIGSIVGSSRLVKESDVPNLPYLQAIVKETLRLHTPAPLIPRECIKDCNINGYDIKSKTKVMINAHAVMRDPNSWSDPDEFIPERFLVNSNEKSGQHHVGMKGQDFRFIPFGSGRRSCPGATLAPLVIHAAIAGLVQCFDWKVKGDGKVDLTAGLGLAAGMANPLLCYPITHFNPFQAIFV